MTQEFTATRTMLANNMATAGAELLDYMGTAGALAAIPNTDPQQYVVAGTLEIIGKLLPAVEQAELTDERIMEICSSEQKQGMLGAGYRIARAIEAEVRSAAREQARNEALEEAAKVCDAKYTARANSGHPREASTARNLAEEIRALKAEAPAASKEGDAK